jgi:hypothetical protein
MADEDRRVAALGDVDPDRVALPSPEVIALQAAAEPAGLHAHDRIDLRIEACVTPQDLEGDRVRVQAIASAGKGLLDHEAQELLEPVRCDEIRARQDPFQLLFDHLARGRKSIDLGCIFRRRIQRSPGSPEKQT